LLILKDFVTRYEDVEKFADKFNVMNYIPYLLKTTL